MRARLGKEFIKLWIGQGVSQFGTQVSLLALPTLAILVYDATPFQVSVIGAVQVAPSRCSPCRRYPWSTASRAGQP